MAASTAELRARRDRVCDADLVELRLDTLTDPDVPAALEGRRLPVIVTCRPRWEGGHFAGSEEERHRLLLQAQQLGAEYIDVEWRAGFDDLVAACRGRGVMLSSHDMTGVPPDLAARVAAMRATGAEIVKVAVSAARLTDSLALLTIARGGSSTTILLAMGEAGVPTRVLAGRFGSCWTYASDGPVPAAPGQLPAARLLDELSFRRVGPATAIYAVVGRPVMHSLSPAMHNAAFGAAGVDAVYVPCAAADFDDFLAFAQAVPIEGASITAPYKVDAYASAMSVDGVGRRLGAVNTVRREPAGWAACNTDVPGFLTTLEGVVLAGRRASVLGAGGAARAVAAALLERDAIVRIHARDRARAESMATEAGASAGPWPPEPGNWDVLVNCTPEGTAPDVEASPLPGGPFGGELVYDLVYTPAMTRLLREAAAAGCRVIGGLDMLVAQAERQFAWWTGSAPPPGVMRRAAEAARAGRFRPSAIGFQ